MDVVLQILILWMAPNARFVFVNFRLIERTLRYEYLIITGYPLLITGAIMGIILKIKGQPGVREFICILG